MKKFEYMRIAINCIYISEFEEQLNRIGSDGWEAFHVQQLTSEKPTMQIEYWYFKREKQQ